jgi:hypothetical protein
VLMHHLAGDDESSASFTSFQTQNKKKTKPCLFCTL